MIFQQLFIGAKLIVQFQRYSDNMTYPMLECFVTFLILFLQEMVTVSVDGSVLERIAKIMTYLRLGSSGKVLKKKKKERDIKGVFMRITNILGILLS
jgi:hypothetical protein